MEGKGLVTGLIDSTAPRLPRFSEVLCPAPTPSFDSFAPLPSNQQALETARLFPSQSAPFVALIGPSGCGKSHLLESASGRLRKGVGDAATVVDATRWAVSPPKNDAGGPLILDNVQNALDSGRVKQQLRLALEHRVRAGRATLLSFTAQKPNRTIRSFLPRSKDWVVCGIQAPEPNEREKLVRQLSSAEGLLLSETLVWLLSHRMNGNGRSLLGALKRLRLHQKQWTDPSMTLRACGVLNPFFSDNSSWDLREHISLSATEFRDAAHLGAKKDLAIFTMLRVAQLGEVDVAHFYEIEQVAAYTAAIRFEEWVSCPSNIEQRNEVLSFLRFTISRLRAD
jgi:energy-coupling factor transporter ATP-binding protein EcfA2